jgi:hypothetical protein
MRARRQARVGLNSKEDTTRVNLRTENFMDMAGITLRIQAECTRDNSKTIIWREEES